MARPRSVPRWNSSKTEGDKLRAAIRECWLSLPRIALFGFFINILFLASPIYLMQIFDRVLGSGHIETLIALAAIGAFALLMMGVIDSIRLTMFNHAAQWLERRMAPNLIAASMRLAVQAQYPTSQPLRDLAAIKAFVGSSAIGALGDVVWTPLFLLVIWHVHPWFGLIGLGAVGILVSLMLLSEFLSKKALARSALKKATNAQRAENIVRNAETVHAMGMAGNVIAYWQRHNSEAVNLSLLGGNRAAWFTGMAKSIRLLIQMAIYTAGAYLILNSELTTGAMMACSIMLARALMPIEQLTQAGKHFVNARDAYYRILQLIDKLEQEQALMLLPAPSGKVDCEDVLFIPGSGTEPVLMNVSFSVDRGMIVGIVGPSGAGKSTLCKMIAGILRPTRGHVRLDGVDIFEWPSEQIGPYVGYVPQETELFEGKVAEIIARMDPEPDSEAVIAAAKAAGAHEMILAFPNGYETELGENRSGLSGGQRQRLALARAFYRRPRLLVLDEPNTNLDGIGEAALARAMQAAKRWGATVFIIAHQLSLLKLADRLLLLTSGRPVMFGTREEVLSTIASGRAKGQPQAVPLESARSNGAQKGNRSSNGTTPHRMDTPASTKETNEPSDALIAIVSDNDAIPVPTKISMVPRVGRQPLQLDQQPMAGEVENIAAGAPPEQDVDAGDRAISKSR